MVTRVLAAGQEDEEIRDSGILILNEQDVKRENCIIAALQVLTKNRFQQPKDLKV